MYVAFLSEFKIHWNYKAFIEVLFNFKGHIRIEKVNVL